MFYRCLIKYVIVKVDLQPVLSCSASAKFAGHSCQHCPFKQFSKLPSPIISCCLLALQDTIKVLRVI